MFRQTSIIIGLTFVSALALAPYLHVHDGHGHSGEPATLFHGHASSGGLETHVRPALPDDDVRWLGTFVLAAAGTASVQAPAELVTLAMPLPDRVACGVASIEPTAHAPPFSPTTPSRAPPA